MSRIIHGSSSFYHTDELFVNSPAIIFVCTVSILGISLGYFGKSVMSPRTGNSHAVIGNQTAPHVPVFYDDVPRLVTSETFESLVAQGDGVSYAALSLWLLDADASEIAAFWENFQKGNPGGDLRRLLFINWTRLDPSAAITATRGTDDEVLVWWAWPAHDPTTAMASATTVEWQKRVAKGAGEFHPDWVRENFEGIPEEARSEAINGIRTWKEDGDHAATLDFLQEHGGGYTGSIFTSFARKDPWAAYDWLVKNEKLRNSRYWAGGEVETLIKQVKELHPDDLERMAAMTPSGQVKWKMEDALFELLLASDPERALENARKGDAPLVNAKRLAAIGDSLLATEPEKAFDLAAEILSISKGGLSPDIIIMHERGGTYAGSNYSGAQDFIEKILAKDPYRTLDMAAVAMADTDSDTFSQLSYTVAQKDLDGYAAWVNRQTDAKSIEQGTGVVVSGLARRGNFHEASEWAMSNYDVNSSSNNGLYTLAYYWGQQNPADASEWLESASVSENHKVSLRSIISRHKK